MYSEMYVQAKTLFYIFYFLAWKQWVLSSDVRTSEAIDLQKEFQGDLEHLPMSNNAFKPCSFVEV